MLYYNYRKGKQAVDTFQRESWQYLTKVIGYKYLDKDIVVYESRVPNGNRREKKG